MFAWKDVEQSIQFTDYSLTTKNDPHSFLLPVVYTKCCKSEDALYPTVNCKQRGTGHESKRYSTKLSYR